METPCLNKLDKHLDIFLTFESFQEQRHGDSDYEENDDSKYDVTQSEIERRQEEIEELTEKVETAKKDQKELFLIVFQVSMLYIYILEDNLLC